MHLSRRQFAACALAGGTLTALDPRLARAEATMPGWQAGFRNAPAEGFKPSVMQRVSGRLPAGLEGSFYRNGPAQFRYGEETASHWFDGDGMVQRMRVEGGAIVHSGRFVSTPKRKAEQAAGRFLAPGFGAAGDPDYPIMSADDVNAANTSVLHVGGELLALWEAGSPAIMDPETLETRGFKSWRDDLKAMPFLAHPKREPDGRVWNLAVGGDRVGIYRISPQGVLEDFSMVVLGAAPYIHDWAMTDRHLIILMQPWIVSSFIPPVADKLSWQPDLGLRVLVLDKADLSNRRWVDAPPRAFFHTGNAWEEEDGTIRIDISLYREPVLGDQGGVDLIKGIYDPADHEVEGRLSQLVLPPAGEGRIEESPVDGEFPQAHPRFAGSRSALTAIIGGSAPGQPMSTHLYLMDWASGRVDAFDFGADQMVEEFLIVPKPGGLGERDAWLIGTTLNIRAQASECHVFDAAGVADGPLASFRADHSWPLGFHGTFVA